MKIPESLSLDTLAAVLTGQKAPAELAPEAQAFLASDVWEFDKKTYPLSSTIVLLKPVRIVGNGAEIRAEGPAPLAFLLSGSGVTVSDLRLTGFPVGVLVDSRGRLVENVTVEKIVIDPIVKNGICVYNSQSNGTLKDITVRECDVTGLSDTWDDVDNEMSAQLPYLLAIAMRSPGSDAPLIEHCRLENIRFENNIARRGFRAPFVYFGSLATAPGVRFHDLRAKGLFFINNKADICWDGAFNLTGAGPFTTDMVNEDIELIGNDVGTGIAGVYLFSAEPVFGENRGSVMRHVVIRDNHFHKSVEDVGEPERMIFAASARLDYYEGCKAYDSVLEDIEISGNTFDGSGPVLTGCYNLLDGRSEGSGNVIRDVRITGNTLLNVDKAFILDGAQDEGRRFDWNFGSPRHNKQWLPPVTDNGPLSRLTDNRVEDVLIEGNVIDGYRYKAEVAGANVRGHAVIKDNKAVKNIVFRNNEFRTGEAHVRIANVFSEDYVTDEGGNEADLEILKEI